MKHNTSKKKMNFWVQFNLIFQKKNEFFLANEINRQVLVTVIKRSAAHQFTFITCNNYKIIIIENNSNQQVSITKQLNVIN